MARADLELFDNATASSLTEIDLILKAFQLNKLEDEEEQALLSIDPKQRKKDGIFFTPKYLANHVVSTSSLDWSSLKILDPACGTGNLLLEIARRLETFESLEVTLQSWNAQLYGSDINPQFILLAKRKLIKEAILKGAQANTSFGIEKYIDIFSNLQVKNFLNSASSYAGHVDCIVMNPPFSHIQTPEEMAWTSGKSNAAASFVYLAAKLLPFNGRIIAILPDVLRSGVRYSGWRKGLSDILTFDMITIGEFEKRVDVDVVVLLGTSKEQELLAQDVQKTLDEVKTGGVQEKFHVSVGPVVPHRDELLGEEAPFAHARSLPPWQIVSHLPERIKHHGRKVKGPFVAIRRTSSPRDRYRAVATIVDCDEPVAVENHIIVATPIDGKLKTCRSLLLYLQTDEVNDFINEKIRCRHLTVGVIKGIPLPRGFDD